MGRYSSDSEEDRKKRKKKKKKRSRSRSKSTESRYSGKQKKSKKSKKKHKSRSRSRSVDSYRRSRSRSRGKRSRSYDRYYSRSKSRSSSRSRSRFSRRSRSGSRGRFSRSRSKERRKRRSRSYDRYTRRSRSHSSSRKDRKKYSEEREDPCLTIPGFSELPPGEQAKIRMQMALKAAAAADEKIKGENSQHQGPTSFKDQLAFNQAIQDIESSGFEAQYFKSSRGDRKEEKNANKDEFTFGTAGEIRLDSTQKKPLLIDIDTDDLADPSLKVDPEERMDRWIQKLAAMRRKKLEGEALT